jgi:hypothetical protein
VTVALAKITFRVYRSRLSGFASAARPSDGDDCKRDGAAYRAYTRVYNKIYYERLTSTELLLQNSSAEVQALL